MGAIRVKTKENRIYFRFYYLGIQREEPSELICSCVGKKVCLSHKIALGKLAEITNLIKSNKFDYKQMFPKSKALANLGYTRKVNETMSFKNYAIMWLEQQDLAYSTLKSYRSTLFGKTIPFFKDVPIGDIKPFHVREFITSLNYPPTYVRSIVAILSIVLNSAVVDEIIPKNPCKHVKTPRVEINPIDVFTMQEASSIIKYSETFCPQLTLFFAIGFYMGLRTGEIMGLKWSDFDFDNYKLKVQRTITNGRLKNSTKTNKNREIDIPIILDKYLENHKQYTFDKNDWVFLTYAGEHFKTYNPILYYYWRPILKHLGLKYLRMYNMRHSFASNSLKNGKELAWIQKMLGHNTPEMIIKRYGNYIPKSSGRMGFSEEDLSTE